MIVFFSVETHNFYEFNKKASIYSVENESFLIKLSF